MDDLISRQAAIDAVSDLYWMDERLLNFKKEIDATFDKIMALPSAQPEIIRCKDCKHHRRDNTGCYYCVRKDYGYGWGLNDFCSDAERT